MIERMVVRLLALMIFVGPQAGQTAKGALPGGFEVGDQILLEVEGDTQFTHAFSVGPGPALTLPVIGAIPLTGVRRADVDRKSTRLNSSHGSISYAVFCLKKK